MKIAIRNQSSKCRAALFSIPGVLALGLASLPESVDASTVSIGGVSSPGVIILSGPGADGDLGTFSQSLPGSSGGHVGLYAYYTTLPYVLHRRLYTIERRPQ